MKTRNILKQGLVTLLCTAVFAGFAACSTDPVEREGGKLPDKEAIESTYGMLRSDRGTQDDIYVYMSEGPSFVSDYIYYQITNGASENLRFNVTIGECPDASDCIMLPEENYEFPNGQMLQIDQNARLSNKVLVKILSEGLAPGDYILPLAITSEGRAVEPGIENVFQTLNYQVSIRARSLNEEGQELNTDQVFLVCYINTSEYDPRLVDDYFIRKTSQSTYQDVWYRTVGNIVNLRPVTLKYDESTGRAMLELGSDARYVLDHKSTYISPLQDKGRKVCLCIEGGGTGLGFCNLSDEQIVDFVAQIKAVLEIFDLDGINFWDRNSGYGKEGMAPVNTTSYPKLIKTLRETIGSDKLITLTDYEDPTAYFWDTEAMGGIAVGEYLDYAWSGYNSEEEQVQIVDPWHQGAQYVSQHERKPIVGLDAAKYGCINIPWYKGTSDLKDMTHIFNWRNAGYKQSQILVTQDLMTVLQNAYEGSLDLGRPYVCFADDGILSFFDLGIPGLPPMETLGNMYTFDVGRLGQIDGKNVYGKWLKDW